jgi:membrane protein YqaA with SNARE-associated domain
MTAADACNHDVVAADAKPPARTSWIRRQAGRLPVAPTIGAAAALDASALPNLIEPMLAAAMLAKPRREWALAAIATLGCAAGSALAYVLGAVLMEPVVDPLIAHFGLADNFDAVKDRLRVGALPAIFVIANTPVPLALASAGAGAAGVNPVVAIGLVVLFRGLRYFAIAAAARYFRPALRMAADRFSSPWVFWTLLAIGALILAAVLAR